MIKDQISGTVVNEINKARIMSEINNIKLQDAALKDAFKEIDKVRKFIGTPENILGSDKTKHGEIAEQVEVGVRRAKSILNGDIPNATFEGVGRTAPEDYIIDGLNVQSKFINGYNNNLNAVLDHMDKYQNFGKDGSYYHIPKDSYETIEKVINGKHVEGLKESTKKAIQEKVAEIESRSGHQFSEVVKPGISDYGEVQIGKVDETLNNHDKELRKENLEKKNIIKENHKPNLNEGLKATRAAAAVGASISLGMGLYKKAREGKKFYNGDFSKEDWKEVGIDTVKGGVVGGISGASIYALTNYASLSAPFAGAVVSAAKGVGSLVKDYNDGNINKAELIELGLITCGESAIVGIATAVGQTIIPIPVLGAVIGSVAGSMLNNFISFDKKTGKMIEFEIEKSLEKLNTEYFEMVKNITEKFEKLGELTDIAFDLTNNINLLDSSVNLARAYNVKEEKIIKSISELDAYMMG